MQVGIGGWRAPRAGVKVGRERGTTVVTVGDVERVGIEKVAEVALETAEQRQAVYLSFDIDVIDAGFVPGTGWPEPGGLLPREALNLVRLVSEPGLAGIEVVECSPPYDWAEQTALLSSRVILDSLAVKLPRESWATRPQATTATHGDHPDRAERRLISGGGTPFGAEQERWRARVRYACAPKIRPTDRPFFPKPTPHGP